MTNIIFLCRIPKNEDVRNKWLKVIKKDKLLLSKHSTVCSDHFSAEQIKYKVFKNKCDPNQDKVFRLIKPGSVPSAKKQIREDNKIYLLNNGCTVETNSATVISNTQEMKSPEVHIQAGIQDINDLSSISSDQEIPDPDKRETFLHNNTSNLKDNQADVSTVNISTKNICELENLRTHCQDVENMLIENEKILKQAIEMLDKLTSFVKQNQRCQKNVQELLFPRVSSLFQW